MTAAILTASIRRADDPEFYGDGRHPLLIDKETGIRYLLITDETLIPVSSLTKRPAWKRTAV